MKSPVLGIAAVVLSIALSGCSNEKTSATDQAPSGSTQAGAPGTAAPAAAAPGAKAPEAAHDPVMTEAKTIFATRCQMCHGAAGKGDGPASASLTPKPRDYSDKAWQASVTDEEIAKAIVEGGKAVGKSELMPASPDLASKPELVAALVKHIRSFAQ